MKLLTGFLIGLIIIIASNTNAQIKADDFFCDTCLVKVPYKYLKQMRLLTIEFDFIKQENDSLYSRVNLYKKLTFNLSEVSSMKDTIILYKEKQIKELEAIPKTVVNVNHTKWYVFAGIIVSSIAVGLITGFFVK